MAAMAAMRANISCLFKVFSKPSPKAGRLIR